MFLPAKEYFTYSFIHVFVVHLDIVLINWLIYTPMPFWTNLPICFWIWFYMISLHIPMSDYNIPRGNILLSICQNDSCYRIEVPTEINVKTFINEYKNRRKNRWKLDQQWMGIISVFFSAGKFMLWIPWMIPLTSSPPPPRFVFLIYRPLVFLKIF